MVVLLLIACLAQDEPFHWGRKYNVDNLEFHWDVDGHLAPSLEEVSLKLGGRWLRVPVFVGGVHTMEGRPYDLARLVPGMGVILNADGTILVGSPLLPPPRAELPPDEAELLALLGAPAYRTREAATAKLLERGRDRNLPLLARGIRSPDLEIRDRCRALMTAWGMPLDPPP